MNHLLVFLAGAFYEALCVGWVHYSERERPTPTALFSMCVGLSQVVGIGESAHDWHEAPFFILGCGVGTYAAVRYKKRKRAP